MIDILKNKSKRSKILGIYYSFILDDHKKNFHFTPNKIIYDIHEIAQYLLKLNQQYWIHILTDYVSNYSAKNFKHDYNIEEVTIIMFHNARANYENRFKARGLNNCFLSERARV